MKKLFLVLSCMFLLLPGLAEASGFSGGHSSVSSRSSSPSGSRSVSLSKSGSGSYSTGYKSASSNVSQVPSSSYGSRSNSVSNGGTYHSGYKSASGKVRSANSNSYNSQNYYQSRPSRSGSFWSHAGAFGAGAFLGSMFHPFGGYYGAGHSYNGFSFMGLLGDIAVIAIIIWIIRMFTRRGRY